MSNASKKVHIFYSKKAVFRKSIPGIVSVATAIVLASYFPMPKMKTDYAFVVTFGVIASLFIYGSIAVILNVTKLFRPKPQITLTTEGIALEAYKVWGLVKWSDITELSRQNIKSYTDSNGDNCLVLKLNELKSEELFDDRIVIKVDYLDIHHIDLYNLIKRLMEN